MSVSPPARPTQIGPPPSDLFADLTDIPSTDDLLAGSLTRYSRPDPATGYSQGQARFDDLSLVGPPVVLQGGLHAVARWLPLVSRFREPGTLYPCAAAMSVGRSIPLFEDVNVESWYSGQGDSWCIATRFADSDRLTGCAWSIAADGPELDLDVDHWQGLLDEAESDPTAQPYTIMSLPYSGTEKLFWSRVNMQAEAVRTPGLRRFIVNDRLSLAFVAYYLDNVAVISRATMLRNPFLTTQIGIAFATDQIPANQELLLMADRTSIRPASLQVGRPVELDGRTVGSETVDMILASGDLATVYARGFLTMHPMDRSVFKPRIAHGAQDKRQ